MLFEMVQRVERKIQNLGLRLNSGKKLCALLDLGGVLEKSPKGLSTMIQGVERKILTLAL